MSDWYKVRVTRSTEETQDFVITNARDSKDAKLKALALANQDASDWDILTTDYPKSKVKILQTGAMDSTCE